MSSLAEMRAQLKALRKEAASHKPVSRMKKADISAQIEALRAAREETAPVASVPSVKPRGRQSATESIKEAKASEFPVRPSSPAKKAAKLPSPPVTHLKKEKAAAKPKMSKAEMRRILDEMTSDEE